MSESLYAVIAPDSPRAKYWESVFLGRAIPIRPGGPEKIQFEDGSVEFAHFADLARLDPVAHSRYLVHQAENWGATLGDVAADLLAHGMPIVAGDDLTITTNPEAVLARDGSRG